MSQKVCPNCRHTNSSEETFCTNCGQLLSATYQTFQQSESPTVEFSKPSPPAAPTANFTGQNQYQNTAPPKKSRTGLWLAILGGIGLIVVIFFGIVALGFFYYVGSQKSYPGYNSNSYSSNTAPMKDTNSPISDANTMTDNEKYRLFYAASKVNDAKLTMKVSKEIGIVDDSGTPTDDYDGFMTGMIGWAFTDTDFAQKLDSKQKALDYINSKMPGISTAPKK